VSAERALPWWASDGPVDGGVDRGVDPIERHRAARRGRSEPAAVDHPTEDLGGAPAGDPWWAGPAPARGDRPRARAAPDAGEPDRPRDRDPDDRPEPTRQHLDACGVCPFCTSVRLLQEARPDVVEHLTEAARHLAAAARSLLDTPIPPAAERPERPGPRRGPADRARPRPATPDGRLQRIVLDDAPVDPPSDPAGGS
jgi:hypothetical protein